MKKQNVWTISKRMSVLCVIITLCFVLTACGSKAPEQSTSGTASEEKNNSDVDMDVSYEAQIGNNSEKEELAEEMSLGTLDKQWIDYLAIEKDDVLTLTILDVLDSVPENSVDVSEERNGSVLAWTEENGGYYDVYIVGKGGVLYPDVSSIFDGCPFHDLSNMESVDLSGLDTSQVSNMTFMFCGCNSLKQLDLSNFDTSQVTDMSAMFMYCSSLEKLDLSSFDTSQVIDMASMFAYCRSLTELDLSSFDTSQVTDMEAMFRYCESLVEVDLSSFDTKQVTDMRLMFDNCKSLIRLDLSNFNTIHVKTMEYMFQSCSSLEYVDISNFELDRLEDMSSMFAWCTSLKDIDMSVFDTDASYYEEKAFYDTIYY